MIEKDKRKRGERQKRGGKAYVREKSEMIFLLATSPYSVKVKRTFTELSTRDLSITNKTTEYLCVWTFKSIPHEW